MLKLFRRKKIHLTPDNRIDMARDKVDEAFIMFHQANDALVEANDELLKAIEETDREINSLKAKLESKEVTKQKAHDEIKVNLKAAEKLQQFLN